MSNVQKVSVDLPPEFLAMIREAIEAGEYASASEVIRDALREWKNRRAAPTLDSEEPRRLWREGVESGPPVESAPVFERLRRKYRRVAPAEK